MNEIKPDTKTNLFLKTNPHNRVDDEFPVDAALKRNNSDRKQFLDKVSKDDAKIAIADAVKDFAWMRKAVDHVADVDNTAKLAQLKKDIREGRYKIDYDQLADKIIHSEF